MKIFGFDITRQKAAPIAQPTQPLTTYWPSGSSNWWFGNVLEPFTGAWQRNMEVRLESVLTFSAVYSCISLIASDIGKLGIKLMQEIDEQDVWEEVEVAAFSPVLRKPNRYQTRIKFIEQWISSKLIHGNAYVLKERDERNVVRRLYVLNPRSTMPLVAPDGSVFYQLARSELAGIEDANVVVPASEIIHDIMVPFQHALCGVSPITACGLAAVQGLNIQSNSTKFFANNSNPGGVLSAPGTINDETAKRLKDYWEQNYGGVNVGKVAVLGDGLKYEAMAVNAVDADLINQLKWSAETVCSVFHVPPYMIGVGPMPSYQNIEALTQQYYSQALQSLIESIELLLYEGLDLTPYYAEFNLDDLLRMDTATQYRTYGEGIKSGMVAINEARKKINLPQVEGGGNYLQQQNYSLEALNKRDTKEDPFAPAKAPAPAPKPQVQPPMPQKLLPDYSKLSADEMFDLMGSAL